MHAILLGCHGITGFSHHEKYNEETIVIFVMHAGWPPAAYTLVGRADLAAMAAAGSQRDPENNEAGGLYTVGGTAPVQAPGSVGATGDLYDCPFACFKTTCIALVSQPALFYPAHCPHTAVHVPDCSHHHARFTSAQQG